MMKAHDGAPILYVFFFKQKTAYEITYGDWSSDVCSSDLYINVASASGWVVQNLPIFAGSPYPGTSIVFDLGAPGPISSIGLFVDYSPAPVTFFSGPPSTSYPVGPTTF